jgi:adenylate cyclase
MFRRIPVILCIICLGIGLIGVLGSVLPVLSSAEENLGLHLLYRLRGVEKPHTAVVVVAIDRKSAKALNLPTAPHKWPRSFHARLLEALSVHEPAVVAFDLIFHDPQPPREDHAFAEAIRRAGNVILTQPIDRETMPLLDDNGMPISRMTIDKRVSAVPLLADAAVAQAPFPLPKVPIKLNQYWRFGPGIEEMPTLPVVAMHAFAKEAFYDFIALLKKLAPQGAAALPALDRGTSDMGDVLDAIQPTFLLFRKDASLASRLLAALDQGRKGQRLSPKNRLVGAFIGLYGAGSTSYLNFYGPPGTIETLSYHELLNMPSSESRIRELPSLQGKAVFVGQTESDWFKANDGFYTAFTEKTGMDISGVEVAATAFANLLEKKGVYPLEPPVHLILLLIWGALCTLIAVQSSTLASAGGLVLLNGLYLGLAHIQFKTTGTWYPLVVPMLVQTPAAYIAGLGWKYRKANTERRNIREAFGYYLPDEIVNRLAANVTALRGGGKVLYSICLFTDAESYTPLSEKLDPEQLTRLMNDYYEAIFKPIKANKGLILQVVGDSVLAIWSAPQPDDRLKTAARKAAIAIHKAVKAFNSRVDHPLPTRIGIHAGEILLGNIGAIDHFEYRPVGDIVNTASRLEGLNKYLGTWVLSSKEALGNLNGSVTRPMGTFIFKGKSKPVQVFEIIRKHSLSPELEAESHRFFTAALEAFEARRWEDADRLFENVLKIDAGDGPSKYYRKLCEQLRRTPPNSDWNGAVHMESK